MSTPDPVASLRSEALAALEARLNARPATPGIGTWVAERDPDTGQPYEHGRAGVVVGYTPAGVVVVGKPHGPEPRRWEMTVDSLVEPDLWVRPAELYDLLGLIYAAGRTRRPPGGAQGWVPSMVRGWIKDLSKALVVVEKREVA